MKLMKLSLPLIAILVFSLFAYSQSGRRVKEIKTGVPSQPREAIESKPEPAAPDEASRVTAERSQDYRCALDGGLERILEPGNVNEMIVSAKEADARAEMTAKPRPSYTKEARRLGIQGFVTLKVLLSATGKVSRIRVVRGLRAGLTENAIRAACKIEFKPAIEQGRPASQWLTAEYVFRLADSSIFGP